MQAIENCKRSGNTEWQEKHQDRIQEIISDYMPSGAGWDSGTRLDMERSTPNKLVFYGDYYRWFCALACILAAWAIALSY